MKTLRAAALACCLSVAITGLSLTSGCVSTPGATGSPTLRQEVIAAAVEDAISFGLVPVFTKNPTYVAAAVSIAKALGSFEGQTLTPADVAAFLDRVALPADDAKMVAGIVNAAWSIYAKRYSAQVGAATRPDVKLFLRAVSNGIVSATEAVPRTI